MCWSVELIRRGGEEGGRGGDVDGVEGGQLRGMVMAGQHACMRA